MEHLDIVPHSQADEMLELRDLVYLGCSDAFKAFMQLPVGATSDDSSAIVGRAGHLFVNDGSNHWRAQLCGEIKLEGGLLDKSAAYIKSCAEEAQKINGLFRLVVVPEKDVVYDKMSPNVSGWLRPHRSVHALQERISFKIVYPDASMRAARDLVRIFHARNSHVSLYGGFILANEVLASLDLPTIRFKDLKTELALWPDDLSMKWAEDFRTTRRILSRSYEEKEIAEVQGHVGRHLIFTNNNARTAARVLLYGDSYAWNPDAGLARFMTYEFREVHFHWSKRLDLAEVADLKPDCIILQTAERFLIKGIGQ